VSKTILVPNWGANEEMQQLCERRRGLEQYQGSMRGYALQFEEWYGCDVIVINGRPREMPVRLEDVPMEYISILQNNSPYRGLHDNWYKEDVEVPGTDGHRFTAHVETYCRGNVFQHSIRVTVSSADIVGVNKWFDALLRGEKNDCCDNPAPLPAQALSVLSEEDCEELLILLQEMISDPNVAENPRWMAVLDGFNTKLRYAHTTLSSDPRLS
jgi:hypothetical protein